MTNLKLEKDERVAVVGKRYNPQLGVYITGPYVGRVARVNKNSFAVKFDNAIDNEYRPKSFDFGGYARSRTDCLYGSMSYEAHTIPETIQILEAMIPKYPAESFKVQQLNNTVKNLRALSPA